MNLLTLLLGASLASAHAYAHPQFGPDSPQIHNLGNTDVDLGQGPGTPSGQGIGNKGNTDIDLGQGPETPSGEGIGNEGNTDLGSFFRRNQLSAPSTLVVRPSPAPMPNAPAMAGSQGPVQDSAKRSDVHARDLMPADGSDGIAPLNLLEPGNDIAPAVANSPHHGEDEGNSFCFGGCYADSRAAKCDGHGVS